MGELPARITAEDFVTPPELADWKLSHGQAGRLGGVRFELVLDRGRTRLGRCYQQIPLRVSALQMSSPRPQAATPTNPHEGEPALVYLVNPTAGLMDGDGQLIEIVAGAGTHAVVAGQSATRIHPGVNGFCTQQWRVTVHPGAILVILPGPAIPFAGCRYSQRVALELHPGAHVIWGDVWTAGRYSRGANSERFRFETIVQDLCVRRHSQLVYRDRFCWHGPWNAESASWHFGAFPAFGSLFASKPIDFKQFDTERQTDQDAAGLVEPSRPLSTSMFPTGHGDVSCRWLGSTEEVIRRLTHTSLALAAGMAGQVEPWLLSANHLGPNHWFRALG